KGSNWVEYSPMPDASGGIGLNQAMRTGCLLGGWCGCGGEGWGGRVQRGEPPLEGDEPGLDGLDLAPEVPDLLAVASGERLDLAFHRLQHDVVAFHDVVDRPSEPGAGSALHHHLLGGHWPAA